MANIFSIDSLPSFLRCMIHVFIEAYSEVLEEAPVLTKALTSATVYSIGDIIAQRSEGAGRLDWLRIVRSLLAGFIGHGPLSHIWYNLSEDFFQNSLGWTAWWAVFPKVVLDQTCWGPFWNNTYIVLIGAMQCQRWETIWADIRRTTIPLVVSGLKLWPAAHLITYGYIPVENRLLWVDLVEILWVTILATQAAGKKNVRRKKKQHAAEVGVLNRDSLGSSVDEESGFRKDEEEERTLLVELPEAKVA